MELRFSLPNPDELTPEQFFTQMRTSLKVVEKSYQQITKDLTEEVIENNFFIRYRFPFLLDYSDNIDELKKLLKNKEDFDLLHEIIEDKGQNISLSVSGI